MPNHTCNSKDCSASGVSRCAMCGEVLCQTHTYLTRNKSARCTGCLSATLERIVVCAVRSGRLEEAAQVLQPWVAGTVALPDAQLYLGMIRAEQGALDSALTLLGAARSAGATHSVAQTMAQIHLLRAAKAVGSKQMTHAAEDVAQAVNIIASHSSTRAIS